MAIIVEEEKSRISLVTVVIWLAILIVIGVAAYYIFFTEPQLVEVTSQPAGFENLNPLSKINLNPNDLLTSQAFQSLKQYIELPVAGNAGRPNPFLAPGSTPPTQAR